MAGITSSYVSSTVFSVSDDLVSIMEVGRRLKLDCGVDGVKSCVVVGSVYNTNNLTTTVTISGDAITTNLVSAQYGIVSPSSLPVHTHAVSGVVTKYATMADIYAIASPSEGDLALSLDTGMIMQYRDNVWVSSFASPNICTVWSKYVDANTVQVQPGEMEINGAIVNVTEAKNVTLSGNLKSGLTEAANTVYYMYAVRPESGNAPTYLFDTQAPLMDRYGNLVASFEDCAAGRAWFHPTLGTRARWIGQVLNNASSNILAFTKCMPGYWEGAWTSSPTALGAHAVPHAFGKLANIASVVYKPSIGSVQYYRQFPYFSNPTSSYGTTLGVNKPPAVESNAPTYISLYVSAYPWFAPEAVAVAAGGYFKLTLTEK